MSLYWLSGDCTVVIKLTCSNIPRHDLLPLTFLSQPTVVSYRTPMIYLPSVRVHTHCSYFLSRNISTDRQYDMYLLIYSAWTIIYKHNSMLFVHCTKQPHSLTFHHTSVRQIFCFIVTCAQLRFFI